MGWPADLTIYKLLTDWGGLIGGGVALIAGLIAYGASLAQVKATKDAVASIAEGLLQTCIQGRGVLTKGRTDHPLHIEKDMTFIALIDEAASKWPGLMSLIAQTATNSG